MIPTSAVFDQSTLAALWEHHPLVADYRAFFASLEWSLVEQWQARRSTRGRPPHPERASLKAFLVRLREGLLFTSQLRRFLVSHPLLVIELGFELHLDAAQPYGFDVERTVPSRQWLREKLRSFDQALLQELQQATVTALQAAIPGLGETVAYDVKHIYAWVKQNNPRVSPVDRFCKEQRPRGDPDCRVGVKRSTNRELPDGSAKEVKEYLWGYGSGVAAATVADYGDVVLAEFPQPFNQNDVTSFHPLSQRTVITLEQFPTHVTADAASAVRCSFQSRPRPPATTSSLPKAKAASRMSTGNGAASSASRWIAPAHSIRPSTPSAPPVSASTARRKRWALNVPRCAMATPLPTSIP